MRQLTIQSFEREQFDAQVNTALSQGWSVVHFHFHQAGTNVCYIAVMSKNVTKGVGF